MSVSVREQTCMCTQAVAKSDCILVSFKVSTDVVYLNRQWMMLSCKLITLSFSWRFTQYPPVCSLFSSSVPSQSPLIYCLGWHGEKSEQFSVWRLSSECWWKQCLWPSQPHYIGGNTMLVVSPTDNATLIIVTYNYVHIYSLVFTQCHYALELSCFCSYVSAFNPVLKSVFAGVVIHDYIIMDDPNSNCIPHCYT